MNSSCASRPRYLDIGAGDEVITVGNSFAATAFAIAYTGAEAVFVDMDPSDFNIDVNLIEEAISERTKAIIPVHLYGQPAKMQELREIADRMDCESWKTAHNPTVPRSTDNAAVLTHDVETQYGVSLIPQLDTR